MVSFNDVADQTRHRVRIAILIEGIPYVFCEQPMPTGTFFDEQGNAITQLEVLEPESLQVGERRIDIAKRREVGATLQVRMREDAAGTLAGLIKPRGSPTTFLTADIGRTDTLAGLAGNDVSVNDSSSFTAGTFFYIGAETFQALDAPTSGKIETVFRFMNSSQAQRHTGGTRDEEASSVFLHPPAWTGRRVYLYAGLADDAGDVEQASLLGVYALTGPPTPLNSGLWELNAESWVTNLANRMAYTGMRDVHADQTDEPQFYPRDSVDVPSDAALFLKPTTATARKAHMMMQLSDGTQSLRACEPAAFSVALYGPECLTPAPGEAQEILGRTHGELIVSMRQVYYDPGRDPVVATLQLLCSRLGDGSENNFDRLPGREPDDWGDPEWYMGANIASFVDTTSFSDFEGLGAPWVPYIDEPMTVGDIAFECAQSVGAFYYVGGTTGDKLRLKRLSDRSEVSTGTQRTVTTNDLLPETPDAVDPIESDIFHTATWRGNYDPIAGEFTAIINVVDVDVARQFPNVARLHEYESRFGSVSLTRGPVRPPAEQRLRRNVGVSDEQIEFMLRRKQRRNAQARMETTVVLPFSFVDIELGDEIVVSNSNASDLNGGTLSSHGALVIGKRVDFETGHVTLRLMLRETASYFAATVEVSSWDNVTKRATLKTDSKWIPTTDSRRTKPARELAAGWGVYFHDVSGNAYASTAVEASGIISDTVVQLTSNAASLGFTPAAGDIITVVRGAAGATNAAGYNDNDSATQTEQTPSTATSRLL